MREYYITLTRYTSVMAETEAEAIEKAIWELNEVDHNDAFDVAVEDAGEALEGE